MSKTNTIVVDAVTIATAVLEITTHSGESAADGLARIFPNIAADQRDAILVEAQILAERKEIDALPDDAPTGELKA